MSCLTGFITGSLGSVWPWKSINYNGDIGNLILSSNNIFFYYPNNLNFTNITILISILSGILIIYFVEKLNVKK